MLLLIQTIDLFLYTVCVLTMIAVLALVLHICSKVSARLKFDLVVEIQKTKTHVVHGETAKPHC